MHLFEKGLDLGPAISPRQPWKGGSRPKISESIPYYDYSRVSQRTIGMMVMYLASVLESFPIKAEDIVDLPDPGTPANAMSILCLDVAVCRVSRETMR